jgi:putative ABC transport system permease protein
MNRLFLKLFRRRRLHRDLQAELAFHREMSAAHHNPIPLGNAAVIREQAFDLWRFNFLENLWRDLVYAARGLRRSPALVLTALLSLGLGIGVNTAMFSLGVEFLFSEPSVRDAGSLVSVRVGGNSNSPEKVIDFIRSSGLFQDVAGENEETFANFNDGVETHRIFAIYTTTNYFTALGVPMLYGRGILPSDPPEVAVLHYRFWRKYFNGDPSVIGRTINLDGRICTIVGILPEHHRTLIGFGYSPDIYAPRYLEDTTLAIYARLKPGMSIAAARAGLVTVAKRMDAAIPIEWKYENGLSVLPIAGLRAFVPRASSRPSACSLRCCSPSSVWCC